MPFEPLVERSERGTKTLLVRLEDRMSVGAHLHDEYVETREPGHGQQFAAHRIEEESKDAEAEHLCRDEGEDPQTI